jgi:glutathione S-transferase
MKLIGSLTSPYVRKVRVVLAEKKIEYDFVLDSPWEANNGVSRYNPLGKIPVLVLDDESSLYDSRVIVEYLDATAPNNRLIPAGGRERIVVRRWEALADGINDAAASGFLEAKRPAEKRSDEWIARQREKIVAGLEAMSADLGEQAWCHSNAISLADLAVGACLGYLDFRYADIDWRTAHPNLARLFEKLMQRPAFAETVPRV